MSSALIPLPVAVPLVVAAFLSLLSQWLPRRIVDTIAVATAGANLCFTAFLLHSCWTHAAVYWFGNWWPRAGGVALGICFVIHGPAAALATLVSLLATAALVFSWNIFEETENHFQPLMLIFMAGMCGFALSGDLFNLFVFFELMSVSAFALCGLKTVEPAPLQGAFNFGVTNSVGAFMIVIGIALVYARTGALNLAQIGVSLGTHADALVMLSFLFLCIGFFVKGAIVPFHFWLADAHAVAPTPVCVLFSGVMVELGLYAVATIYTTAFQCVLAPHQSQLRVLLMVLATATAIVGALMCFCEHHLKRMLAFSTVAHAGLMLAGVSLFDPRALGGFFLYVFSHGVIKGGLFLGAGIVLHHLRKIGEPHLHGRGRGLWSIAGLFLAAAWGLAGAPPFGTLLGEAMISGAAHPHFPWLKFLFLFVEILTAGAVLRMAFRIFFGWGKPAPSDPSSRVEERPETREEQHRPHVAMVATAAVLVLLGIALGLMPQARSQAEAQGKMLFDQDRYARAVLQNAAYGIAEKSPEPSLASSAIRSSVAGVLAVLLALASVFREPVGGWLNFTRRIEFGIPALRQLHSGHPGDYVAWLSVGTALLGLACMWIVH